MLHGTLCSTAVTSHEVVLFSTVVSPVLFFFITVEKMSLLAVSNVHKQGLLVIKVLIIDFLLIFLSGNIPVKVLLEVTEFLLFDGLALLLLLLLLRLLRLLRILRRFHLLLSLLFLFRLIFDFLLLYLLRLIDDLVLVEIELHLGWFINIDFLGVFSNRGLAVRPIKEGKLTALLRDILHLYRLGFDLGVSALNLLMDHTQNVVFFFTITQVIITEAILVIPSIPSGVGLVAILSVVRGHGHLLAVALAWNHPAVTSCATILRQVFLLFPVLFHGLLLLVGVHEPLWLETNL